MITVFTNYLKLYMVNLNIYMFTQFPTWYTFPLLHDIHLHVCHYAKFLAFLPPNRPTVRLAAGGV